MDYFERLRARRTMHGMPFLAEAGLSGELVAIQKEDILKLALDLLEHDRSPMRRCLVTICERWSAGEPVDSLRRDYGLSSVGEVSGAGDPE